MKLFLFILIAYGISNILVFGSIFKGWRTFWTTISPNFFGTLFNCMICLPTYIGFFGSWLVWSPTLAYGVVTESVNFLGLFSFSPKVISVFLDGCLASGAVWLVHSIQEALERHNTNPVDDDDNTVQVDFPE